ncbi:MAG TPA: glycosyl hydrolase family 28-related protein [Flavitalea sp.]|nr:glycosyl hydrolase family 28-related protein [Flavitalea sp.]
MKFSFLILISASLVSNRCTRSISYTEGAINVFSFGAKGNGKDDDTHSIRSAMEFIKNKGHGTVFFPAGVYLIKENGSRSGILQLFNEVSLKGEGADRSIIKLSGDRFNPPSLFYQAWRNEPAINNIIVEGLTFDGNITKQKFDRDYQFCHALSVNNGRNIEVKNCKFQNFRGDGLLFGDTDLPYLNARITRNVKVHHNEFVNIYREGIMFCCIDTAYFHHNTLSGNGYLVGGVDIERHSMNEQVTHVFVYENVFDFRNGIGPIERGALSKFRRGISLGFFYKGYQDGIVDSLSGGHSIYSNTIYEGQIDCYGHINVDIRNNKIINVKKELLKIAYVSPYAINVSDPHKTSDLKNITIVGNSINSQYTDYAIRIHRYKNVKVTKNRLARSRYGTIELVDAKAIIKDNVIH